jgi:hypothetical protein
MTIIHSFIPIFCIPPIGCLPNNENVLYYYLYFYYPVLVGILPIFFSSLFSLIAFRNVRHVIRHQVPIVRQLTAMIFIRVIVFVITYLSYGVYRNLQKLLSHQSIQQNENKIPKNFNKYFEPIFHLNDFDCVIIFSQIMK